MLPGWVFSLDLIVVVTGVTGKMCFWVLGVDSEEWE